MTSLERTAIPVPGPKFERIDGEVMFQFVIDGGSIIGPRPATKADRENHVEAWRIFNLAEAPAVEAKAPGFEKPEDPLNERDTLRRDLKMLGVEVDARWGVPRLKSELEKATAPKA